MKDGGLRGPSEGRTDAEENATGQLPPVIGDSPNVYWRRACPFQMGRTVKDERQSRPRAVVQTPWRVSERLADRGPPVSQAVVHVGRLLRGVGPRVVVGHSRRAGTARKESTFEDI